MRKALKITAQSAVFVVFLALGLLLGSAITRIGEAPLDRAPVTTPVRTTSDQTGPSTCWHPPYDLQHPTQERCDLLATLRL